MSLLLVIRWTFVVDLKTTLASSGIRRLAIESIKEINNTEQSDVECGKTSPEWRCHEILAKSFAAIHPIAGGTRNSTHEILSKASHFVLFATASWFLGGR